MGGSKQPTNQMDGKIGGAVVTRVLNLGNVLELVNDRFNTGSFAEQELVGKVHEMIFPVFTYSVGEM